MFDIQQTKLPGVRIITPTIHKDPRGYLFESYHQKKFFDHGIDITFVQHNQSLSSYGTIRGLHFQAGQSKLVRVLHGKILDVVVDVNPKSKTYAQHIQMELDDVECKLVFIPVGYAHGFSVLSETATVEYKCDLFYDKENESGVVYNDPTLKIDWKIPLNSQIVSEKDKRLPLLRRQ